MNWFYASPEGRHGPVDDDTILRLVMEGKIKPDTLVWREGMADWVPYKDSGDIKAGTHAAGTCNLCRKSFSPGMMVTVGGQSVCQTCQPLAVQNLREGGGGSHAEKIRRDLINQESSIKTIGALQFLGGLLLIGVGVMALLGNFSVPRHDIGEILISALITGLGALQIWVGMGMRRLDGRVRVLAGVLAIPGLFGFPIGTIFSIWIMSLVFNANAKTIFSEDYKAIIAQTPHVKVKTSVVTWVLLAILFLIFVGVLAAIFLR